RDRRRRDRRRDDPRRRRAERPGDRQPLPLRLELTCSAGREPGSYDSGSLVPYSGVPAPAVAAAGLAFALTLTDGGHSITSDRFALRAPGIPGAIVLELQNPDIYGSTFAAPMRVRNETEADLLAVSAEIVSLTET